MRILKKWWEWFAEDTGSEMATTVTPLSLVAGILGILSLFQGIVAAVFLGSLFALAGGIAFGFRVAIKHFFMVWASLGILLGVSLVPYGLPIAGVLLGGGGAILSLNWLRKKIRALKERRHRRKLEEEARKYREVLELHPSFMDLFETLCQFHKESIDIPLLEEPMLRARDILDEVHKTGREYRRIEVAAKSVDSDTEKRKLKAELEAIRDELDAIRAEFGKRLVLVGEIKKREHLETLVSGRSTSRLKELLEDARASFAGIKEALEAATSDRTLAEEIDALEAKGEEVSFPTESSEGHREAK